MTDIFLSYAHEDRRRVRPIVELLESEGWTIWWDRGIQPGTPWEPELEKELAHSRAIVVVWSEASKESEWVHREAQAGIEKGALVPLLIDPDALPATFAHIQASDLSAWRGRTDLDEVEALLRRLAGLVPPSNVDTVRPGYAPHFLGDDHPILLPGVTGSVAVLRYLHFTVVMNPGRRLAHYTAYNINGTQRVRIPRSASSWAVDPLLPPSLQIDHELLKRSSYDRGHLMARSNVSWGEEREASIAARQAFFWPNIAPQEERMNRRWWLALEKWESRIANARGRASGFSGPIFSDDDEPFRGEIQFEHGLVAYDTFRVPSRYWKVLAAVDSGGTLAVGAFLLDSQVLAGGGRGHPFTLADHRVGLAELEERAGLHFPPVLHDAPPIADE